MSQVGEFLGSSCFVSPCPDIGVSTPRGDWDGQGTLPAACGPTLTPHRPPQSARSCLLGLAALECRLQVAAQWGLFSQQCLLPHAARPSLITVPALLSALSPAQIPRQCTLQAEQSRAMGLSAALCPQTLVSPTSVPAAHPPPLIPHIRQSSHIHAPAQPSLHQQSCPAQQSVLDGMEIQPPPRGWHCGDSVHTSLHPSSLRRK